jgi:hypothetical protein
MKIITPYSNIVRLPNPKKMLSVHDMSVPRILPPTVVKKSKTPFLPLVKTSIPNL